MKYSTYNTVIKLSANVYSLYNAITDRFILFKKEIINDLALSPEDIKAKNHALYEELRNAEAIVEDNKDEYIFLKNLSREIDLNDNEFKLIINPTLDCNLRCWYCYENHIKGSAISDETFQKIAKFVVRIFDENDKLKHFQVYFFGGEPLMNFKIVKELITFISDCCNRKNISLGTTFTTNGTLVNEKIIQFLKSCTKDNSFQITLDGSRKFHDKVRFLGPTKGTYDKILHNIQLLLDNNIFVILRINYTKENILSIPSILQDIKEYNDEQKKYLRIDFQRVWQDNSDGMEIDNLLEQFSNANISVTSPTHNMDYLRHPCYADHLNELVINYNGDVYKCTARDFSTLNRSGFLSEDGTVIWTGMTSLERIEKKMIHDICKKCNILPLCGGGCAQKCIELKDGNRCMYGYDENNKKKVILDRFYNIFVKNSKVI